MAKKTIIFILFLSLAFVYLLFRLYTNIRDLNQAIKRHQEIARMPSPVVVTPTPIPINTPTIKSNIKYLNYQSPENWFRVTDSLATFELRFDPSKFKIAFTSDRRIGLQLSDGRSGPVFQLLSYNGGSRHSFIKTNSSCITLPETIETEYNVGGKSGLILTKVDCSATYLVGVVVASKSQAWLITSTGDISSDFESIISTLKLL